MTEKLYPLTLNLTGKHVVIVGAGTIALRKTKGLIGTGAKITVVAPEILPEFAEFKEVIRIQRPFFPEVIQAAHLIYIATNDVELNKTIAQSAASWQWVNDVSDFKNSSFYTPALIREGDWIIGISTVSRKPGLAGMIKKKLKAIIRELYLDQKK